MPLKQVSKEVDEKLEAQRTAGTPLRLAPQDWVSGDIPRLVLVTGPDALKSRLVEKISKFAKHEENTMSNDLVWVIGFKEEAGFLVERTFLDGDPRKIEYVDTTLDMGDNPTFKTGLMYAGREVKPEHIPTKMM